MPAYYPIFLDIRGRRCLVIGGNHEGERKIRYLLDCGGTVTLLSPDASEGLQELVADGKIEWERRGYETGDLQGVWVAIVADTSDAETNEAVSREARARGVMLNVMDVTPLCTFIAPSIIHREDVTVAVSTAGTSPALARRLRERIGDRESCQCLRWADMGPMLADVRTNVRARNLDVTPDEWQECITDELLEEFESGERARARRRLLEALEARAAARARA